MWQLMRRPISNLKEKCNLTIYGDQSHASSDSHILGHFSGPIVYEIRGAQKTTKPPKDKNTTQSPVKGVEKEEERKGSEIGAEIQCGRGGKRGSWSGGDKHRVGDARCGGQQQ
ncbi:hypothetical protein QQ045_005260 [Rhodiola kirilowii]